MSSLPQREIEGTSASPGQGPELIELQRRIDTLTTTMAGMAEQLQWYQRTYGQAGREGQDHQAPDPNAAHPPPPSPRYDQEHPHRNPQAQEPIYHPFDLEFPQGAGAAQPPPAPPANDALLKRMEKFDNFMKQAQGTDRYGTVDYGDLCLFPDVQLPPKFKIPDFPKYGGTGDPMAHLRMFVNLLGNPSNDPRIAMRVFARSLEGDALAWYLRLDPKSLTDWNDLATAFIKQYEFNRDLEPDRFALMGLKKKPSEEYREYVRRWRAVAAKVTPPMSESEMVKVFIDAQEAPYYDKLAGMIGKSFSEVIQQAEVVERGLRSGKMVDVVAMKLQMESIQSTTSLGKKPLEPEQGEEDNGTFFINQATQFRSQNGRPNPSSSTTFFHSPSQHQSYYPQPIYQTSARPHYHPYHHPQPMLHSQTQVPVQHPNYPGPDTIPQAYFMPAVSPNPRSIIPNLQKAGRPTRQQQRRHREFTDLGQPLDRIYEQLRVAEKLGTIRPKTYPHGVPADYDPHAFCAYHSGSPGHSTTNCWTLRHKVQDMIEAGENVVQAEVRVAPTDDDNWLS